MDFSTSLNLNANFFFIGISWTISYSIDSNGDSAIQFSKSTPWDDGTLNVGLIDAGASLSCSYTNLESVDNLNETATYMGGAVGGLGYISGDVILTEPPVNSNSEVIGGQIGVGIGLGVDTHIIVIDTKTIIEKPKGLIERIFEWIFK